MVANNLLGNQYGSLTVIAFDKERYECDKAAKAEGKINRVKRHWLCKCSKCGKTRSVETSNLVGGNTRGCSCDQHERSGEKSKKYNTFEYDADNKCYKLYASNTNNVFLIDECDYESVKKHCWYENNDGYLMTRLDKKTLIFLHRFIMFGTDCKYDRQTLVDHQSRDKHDNRRSNLRLANPAENARNCSMSVTNTSGCIGVSEYAPNGKWRAYICVDRKFISLGYYDNKDDAIKARQEAEIKYFGEFAPV